MRVFNRQRTAAAVLGLLLPLLTLARCTSVSGPDGVGRPFEVWLIDQSDSKGKSYGGTLHIYDSGDLDADDLSMVTPREVVDLGGAVSSLCNASTGANPVRPHMLLFNREHTHAILSFVASGHVALIDAASRQPLACVRTSQSATG